jgi:hypothetical protein
MVSSQLAWRRSSFMHGTRIACHTLFAALACAATAARADLYKWVDARGVVTYTNVPSPEAKASGRLERVAVEASTVSTYSLVDSSNTATGSNAAADDRALRERVARLERELEVERRARILAGEMTAGRAAADAKEAQRQLALRERCLADRRTDCDRADLAHEDSPAVLMVARPPQVIRQLIVQPVIVRRVPPHLVPHLPLVPHRSPDQRSPALQAPVSPSGLGTAPRAILQAAVPASGPAPRPGRHLP